MAGYKIDVPANGSTDYSDFVTITGHSRRHMMFVSFTNTTSTGAPAIESGSFSMINGTMYCLTPSTGGNETISTTGLSTSFSAGELWIKAIPTTGSGITSQYTTVAPTWSAAKGGYYSTGNDKYLGGCYKTAGPYGEKWAYPEGQRLPGGNSRPILSKTQSIGVWDMDGTTDIIGMAILYGTNKNRIRNVYINIIRDDSSLQYPLSAAGYHYFQNVSNNVEITMHRTNAGLFDGVNFNSTTLSRGDICIDHEG